MWSVIPNITLFNTTLILRKSKLKLMSERFFFHWQYLRGLYRLSISLFYWNTHKHELCCFISRDVLISLRARTIQKYNNKKKKISDLQLLIKALHSLTCSVTASYLHTLLNRDVNDKLATQLYVNSDDFSFSIVSFPCSCSNILIMTRIMSVKAFEI